MSINYLKRKVRSVVTLNRDREYNLLRQMLHLQADDILLDIGSGDGYWTQRLARQVGTTIGLEPSKELLAFACQMHTHPKLTYVEGSAESIPFPDQHFTKIISISCFEHFADQEKAMAEIKRVLRPDGVLAMSVDSLLPENSTEEFRHWHQQKHYVTRYFREQDLKQLVEQHGFAYDKDATKTLFNSHFAAQLRQTFIRNPRIWLPLWPVFYLGARLGDTIFSDIPGEVTLIRAISSHS